MESLFQAFANATPPQWLTLLCCVVIAFFLKRMIKTFDKMEESITVIKETVVRQDAIQGEHDRRLNNLEEKVFP